MEREARKVQEQKYTGDRIDHVIVNENGEQEGQQRQEGEQINSKTNRETAVNKERSPQGGPPEWDV